MNLLILSKQYPFYNFHSELEQQLKMNWCKFEKSQQIKEKTPIN